MKLLLLLFAISKLFQVKGRKKIMLPGGFVNISSWTGNQLKIKIDYWISNIIPYYPILTFYNYSDLWSQDF